MFKHSNGSISLGYDQDKLALIPIELLLETAYKFLDLTDVWHLSISCKLFYQSIFCADILWIELAKREGIYEDNNDAITCKNSFRLDEKFSQFLTRYNSKHWPTGEGEKLFIEVMGSSIKLSHLECFLRFRKPSYDRMKKLIIYIGLPIFRDSQSYASTLQRLIINACGIACTNHNFDDYFHYLVNNLYRQLKDTETDQVDRSLIGAALKLNHDSMGHWLNSLVSDKVLKRFHNNSLQGYDMYDLALFFLKQKNCYLFDQYFQIFQSYHNRKQDFKEKFKEIINHPVSSHQAIQNFQIFNQEYLEIIISAQGSLFANKEYCKRLFTSKKDSLDNELRQKAFNFFIQYQGKSWEIDYLFSTYINIILRRTDDDFIEKNKHLFYEIFFNHWKEVIETQDMIIELSKIDLERTIQEMLNADPLIYLSIYREQKNTEIINIFKTYSNSIEAKEQESMAKLKLSFKKALKKHGIEKAQRKKLLKILD